MKLYIHIGWHKTGTSAIQEFLYKNRDFLIDKFGIYYPNEGLLETAHHKLAWAFQNRKKSKWGDLENISGHNYLKEAIRSCFNKNVDFMVVSSEEFCTFSFSQVKELHEATSRLDIEPIIIAYARRQDLIFESAYNMEVKWWATRINKSFDQYIKEKFDKNIQGDPPYFIFSNILDRWEKIFRKKNIILRIYDPATLNSSDVRFDFLKSINCSANDFKKSFDFQKTRSINESLGPLSLEFIRIMNSINMDKNKHNKLVKAAILFEKSKGKGIKKSILFSPEERINFLSYFIDDNKRLFRFNKDAESFCALNKDAFEEKNTGGVDLSTFISVFDFCTRHSAF